MGEVFFFFVTPVGEVFFSKITDSLVIRVGRFFPLSSLFFTPQVGEVFFFKVSMVLFISNGAPVSEES